MKKFLLFITVAVMAISASAQGRMGMMQNDRTKSMPIVKYEKSKTLPTITGKESKMNKAPKKEASVERSIVTIPETAEKNYYNLNYYYFYYYFWVDMSGYRLNVYTDGNDVYFENLFSSIYYIPIKGEKKEDGTIVIKKQKVYEGIDYYEDGSEYDDLYFTLIEEDEEGNMTYPDTDIVLYPTEDGGYTMTQSEDETIMYGLCDQYGYYWALDANASITPFTAETEPVALPEGAEPQDATYKYKYDSSDTQYSECELHQMYADGDNVYLDGLCPESNGWVKGTVKDGKLTVPTNQFLGYNDSQLLTFKAGKNYTYSFEWIDEENYEYDITQTYEPADELTFTNVDGKWVLDEGQCVVEAMPDGTEAGIYIDNEVKAYPGDTPAVPADPNGLVIYDYYDSYGQYCLSGNTPNLDVNGDYINPEKMEISIWEDGDILTLTADDGYSVSEDITWMPYGWMDDNGGYDLAFASFSPYFYLYESLFTELGMQVSYTVDGVTNYSNVVYVDLDGNTRTETGINGVYETISKNDNRVYNLSGQRVTGNFKGIVIKNGKKMLMK